MLMIMTNKRSSLYNAQCSHMPLYLRDDPCSPCTVISISDLDFLKLTIEVYKLYLNSGFSKSVRSANSEFTKEESSFSFFSSRILLALTLMQ